MRRKQREYDRAVEVGRQMDQEGSWVEDLLNKLVQYVLTNQAVRMPTEEKVEQWLDTGSVQRALLSNAITRNELAEQMQQHTVADQYPELAATMARVLRG